MAMLLGLVIGWWILLPILTAGVPGAAEEVANAVFRSDVRFFGAGVIGVAAIWTLLKLLGPIVGGIKSAHRRLEACAAAATALPLVERDIPIGRVGAGHPRARWSRSPSCSGSSSPAARSPAGAVPLIPLHPGLRARSPAS